MTRRCLPPICRRRRFETAPPAGAKKPKSVANWILNDLQSALSAANKSIAECPITPAAFDELVNLIEEGKINSKQGKEVFAEMFTRGHLTSEIVKEKGLEQLTDSGAIEALAEEVIMENPGPMADFKASKLTALNFLKGQVMKLSKRKANPSTGRGNSPEETSSSDRRTLALRKVRIDLRLQTCTPPTGNLGCSP